MIGMFAFVGAVLGLGIWVNGWMHSQYYRSPEEQSAVASAGMYACLSLVIAAIAFWFFIRALREATAKAPASIGARTGGPELRAVEAGRLPVQAVPAEIPRLVSGSRGAAARRPAWLKASRTSSLLYPRKEAIQHLSDPAALAKVAKSDISPPARLTAIEEITDQAVLYGIARNDELRTVRIAAVNRLTDQPMLAELVRGKDVHASVRLAAVERVEDQALLGDIAINNKNRDMRMAAVDRLTDQRMLGEVVRLGPWGVTDTDDSSGITTSRYEPDAADFAISKVTDQAALAGVANLAPTRWPKGPRGEDVRWIAFSKLTDQALLAAIASNSADLAMRERAAEKLHDQALAQTVYADVIRDSTDPAVRLSAAGKAADQALAQTVYADVIRSSTDPAVRLEAAGKLADQALAQTVYADVVRQTKFPPTLLRAAGKLADQALAQTVYADLVKSSQINRSWHKSAVEKLTDQTLLADIARNASSALVRAEAVRKLTDPAVLAGIAESDREKHVSEAAAASLSRLRTVR